MIVQLDFPEIEVAVTGGIRRRLRSMQRGLRDSAGFRGDKWEIDIEGAAAEYAAAKGLGVYWSPKVDTFKAGDLGPVQIRLGLEDRYSLIIRPNDHDDDPFLLVVGRIPAFRLVGWVYGRDGKQDLYWKAPNGRPGAWFLPQSALRPIEELRSMLLRRQLEGFRPAA
jgi:hypothetical protein